MSSSNYIALHKSSNRTEYNIMGYHSVEMLDSYKNGITFHGFLNFFFANSRFLESNTNISMLSWVSLDCLGLTIIPEALNTLSEAQLDAAIHRYLLAESDS